jgi:hypothetical protein
MFGVCRSEGLASSTNFQIIRWQHLQAGNARFESIFDYLWGAFARFTLVSRASGLGRSRAPSCPWKLAGFPDRAHLTPEIRFLPPNYLRPLGQYPPSASREVFLRRGSRSL